MIFSGKFVCKVAPSIINLNDPVSQVFLKSLLFY